jgi:hypothetical protein
MYYERSGVLRFYANIDSDKSNSNRFSSITVEYQQFEIWEKFFVVVSFFRGAQNVTTTYFRLIGNNGRNLLFFDRLIFLPENRPLEG